MKKHTPAVTYLGASRALAARSGAAWLLSSALVGAALLGTTTKAEVLDTFDDPANSARVWTHKCSYGACDYAVTNGVAVLGVTPAGDHGFSYLWSMRKWTLRQDKTVEFRADLVSSSGDGAVGYIAFALGDESRMYMLGVDRDTIVLLKRASPMEVLFSQNDFSNGDSNLKLVLSMTGVSSGVLLKLQVLNKDNGAVLFENEVLDAPRQSSYLGLSGLFEMAVYHDNARVFDPEVGIGRLDRAEAVFDNVEVQEYSEPLQEIARAVSISWPEDTREEQIVLGSDSLASNAVWRPWPEPVFKRQGRPSMSVPITATQQFFKLVPGKQFADDFSDLGGLCASRYSWLPWFQDATGEDWAVTNGVLRVQWNQPAMPGFAMLPLGTNVAARFRDFYASVDVLSWTTSSNNTITVAIAARGDLELDEGVAYFAGFDANADRVSGRVKPWIYNPSTAAYTFATPFDRQQVPPPYRLEFSGVGNRLLLRILHRDTGQVIRETSLNDGKYNQGLVALWFNGTSAAGDSFTVSTDNFFLTGTKP